MDAIRHRPNAARLGAVLVLAVGLGSPQAVRAQIELDGTVGPAGALTDTGSGYVVPDSVGARAGGNLFHSFSRFNLGTGETATFTGPDDVANVISRVTGGERSSIDGTLRSQVGKADFWFINPAGVVFGPNARIDVPAAFHLGTADEVRFADGAAFSATTPSASRLTVAAPEAFGFLRPDPAGIAVNSSQIETKAGQTLSLVAGDLQVTGGRIASTGGQVNLVAMAGPGTVRARDGAPSVPARGAVRVAQGAEIDTSGPGGGQITIRAGQLVVDSSNLQAGTEGSGASRGIDIRLSGDLQHRNGRIRSDTTGSGAAGPITVEARNVALTDGAQLDASSSGSGPAANITMKVEDTLSMSGYRDSGTYRSGVFANGSATGRSGNISIRAGAVWSSDGRITTMGLGGGVAGTIELYLGSLSLLGGGQIDAGTEGAGAAGSIKINASGPVVLSSQTSQDPSQSGVFAGSGVWTSTGWVDGDPNTYGNAGEIAIAAPSLDVVGSSRIMADSYGGGRSGSVEISAGTLSLINGGQISNSSHSLGNVKGGNMHITASQGVAIVGLDEISEEKWRSGLYNDALGPADAGDIIINAPSLVVDGGRIITKTATTSRAGSVNITVDQLEIRNEGQIFVGTWDRGPGGDLIVHADSIVIFGTGDAYSIGSLSDPDRGDTGLFSNVAEEASGSGGKIEISARNIRLANRGQIGSGTFDLSSGVAGSMRIQTAMLAIDGGLISANTRGSGPGGSIAILADRLALSQGGQIIAGTSSSGDGGSLTVTANEISVSQNGDISTQATGSGQAGDIRLTVAKAFSTRNGQITTQAVQGDGGNLWMTVGGTLDLVDSSITTSVQSGRGSGGNITIDPPFMILQRSRIQANAFGGNGGNIRIAAGNLIRSPDSVIEASSQLGISGQINISAPDTDIAGSLTALPVGFLDATALLPTACAARLGTGVSSLTASGLAGLPADPGRPLVASYTGHRPLDRAGGPAADGVARSAEGSAGTAPAPPGGGPRLSFACAR